MTTKIETKGLVWLVGSVRERANLFIEQELRRVAIKGIVPAHGSVLSFLFKQNEPVAIKEIVDRVGRVKSTVTGMIHTLEQHGYIEKFQSPEDGRVMLVQLTDRGRAIRPQFEKISANLQEKVYGDLPQEDRETVVQLLNTIRKNLG
jgi:DNA-binding MarR family transcriptional regulator